MKPKTTKIIYWIMTILFALFMLFSGVQEMLQTKQAQDIMVHLGYPLYVLYILGIAKILGAIAILQSKFNMIKEWAYAGFTIDIFGAAMSNAFVDGIAMGLFTMVFLLPMVVSYVLGKKIEKQKADLR